MKGLEKVVGKTILGAKKAYSKAEGVVSEITDNITSKAKVCEMKVELEEMRNILADIVVAYPDELPEEISTVVYSIIEKQDAIASYNVGE